MKFVWEVLVEGGDADDVRNAVQGAVEDLRGGGYTAELTEAESAAWREDLIAAAVVDVAVGVNATSVLVEIETSDAADDGVQIGARLSGGFDTAVLDAVMAQPGVRQASHSDRIQRLTA